MRNIQNEARQEFKKRALTFRVKVFKGRKLVHHGLGLAPSSQELWDSAVKRYFPCYVSVMYCKPEIN